MRRIVRDRVATSIEQAKPQLEDYIAHRLQYPEAFPYCLQEPVASIREVRMIRITPLFRSDYPPVEIVVMLFVSLTGRASYQHDDIGLRTLDLDVELAARGTVRGDGTYDVASQAAKLKAWWSGVKTRAF